MNSQDWIDPVGNTIAADWHCLWLMKRLTVVSIATIAVVAWGIATVATVVATVVISSIGIVTIAITTITAIATRSRVTLAPLMALLVACNTTDSLFLLADASHMHQR